MEGTIIRFFWALGQTLGGTLLHSHLILNIIPILKMRNWGPEGQSSLFQGLTVRDYSKGLYSPQWHFWVLDKKLADKEPEDEERGGLQL